MILLLPQFAERAARDLRIGETMLLDPNVNETTTMISARIPDLYGESRHLRTEEVDRRRDDAELAVLRACLKYGLPVLGICRGAQILNIEAGGSLIQDITDYDININHRQVTHRGDLADGVVEHEVTISGQSMVGTIMGMRAQVNSRHHQGIGRLGTHVRAVAVADDGLVEAIEAPAHEFALGVLWHDEMHPHTPLLDALVQYARRRSRSQTRACLCLRLTLQARRQFSW